MAPPSCLFTQPPFPQRVHRSPSSQAERVQLQQIISFLSRNPLQSSPAGHLSLGIQHKAAEHFIIITIMSLQDLAETIMCWILYSEEGSLCLNPALTMHKACKETREHAEQEWKSLHCCKTLLSLQDGLPELGRPGFLLTSLQTDSKLREWKEEIPIYNKDKPKSELLLLINLKSHSSLLMIMRLESEPTQIFKVNSGTL